MLVHDLMNAYRNASTETFQRFFRHDEFLADRFIHVDLALFQTMVLDRVGGKISETQGHPGILFGSTEQDVPITVQGAEAHAALLQPDDRVAFIALIDGRPEQHDAAYVRGRVVSSRDPGLIGSEIIAAWWQARFHGDVED